MRGSRPVSSAALILRSLPKAGVSKDGARGSVSRRALRTLLSMRIVGAVALLTLASSALAQGYPDKPIRILVGFAAGGPADITARLIGDRLSEAWGKPVIVENITGAAGNLATDRVAKAAPDGYTLLAAASATIVTNPSLYQKLPFDPVKDLAPITQAVYTPNILA